MKKKVMFILTYIPMYVPTYNYVLYHLSWKMIIFECLKWWGYNLARNRNSWNTDWVCMDEQNWLNGSGVIPSEQSILLKNWHTYVIYVTQFFHKNVKYAALLVLWYVSLKSELPLKRDMFFFYIVMNNSIMIDSQK